VEFLNIADKSFLITGVANRKSVAWHVGRVLTEAGARVIYSVRTPQRQASVQKLVRDSPVLVCDVEFPEQIERLRGEVAAIAPKLDGLLHSIAFADYTDGMQPFHRTSKRAFLRAIDISCFSLVGLSQAFAEVLTPDASVVTISISTTRMAAENYGYMAPIKAALESSVVFLAKSFSEFSRVRFNSIGPSLLKTSASAGIPGYVDSYLFAEKVIPRKAALETEEVANVAAFLLSPRSSGINAQHLVVDAGMAINYFDREIVRKVNRDE